MNSLKVSANFQVILLQIQRRRGRKRRGSLGLAQELAAAKKLRLLNEKPKFPYKRKNPLKGIVFLS